MKYNIKIYTTNWCASCVAAKNLFKQLEFKISDESAWDVGLACGGEIKIFIEKINSWNYKYSRK